MALRLQPADEVRGRTSVYVIADQFRAPGGGGVVYRLQDPNSHLLLKVLHSRSRCQDVEKLSGLLVYAGLDLSQGVAIPLDIVVRDGSPIGYIMGLLRESDWVSINDLFLADRSWSYRVLIARDVAQKVARIHRAKFIIGDFSPPNILWNPDTAATAFIDVDSWGYNSAEVRAKGDRLNRGQAGSKSIRCGDEDPRPEYMPAGVSPEDGPSRQTDLFALGCIIHEILFGTHPYVAQPVGADANKLDNMVDGRAWILQPAAYRLDKDRYPHGHPGLSVLPGGLAQLFESVFTSNAPTGTEWVVQLAEASDAITLCGICGHERFASATCEFCWRQDAASTSTAPAPPLSAQDDQAASVSALPEVTEEETVPDRPARDFLRDHWQQIVAVLVVLAAVGFIVWDFLNS